MVLETSSILDNTHIAVSPGEYYLRRADMRVSTIIIRINVKTRRHARLYRGIVRICIDYLSGLDILLRAQGRENVRRTEPHRYS